MIPLFIFITAAISDAVDGSIARKRNLVTNFGKLMDPLADKLLVCAALIAMSARGILPAWVTVLIVSREFIVTGLRQLSLERNVVIAASFWAKMKTIFQMILIIFLMVNFQAYLDFPFIREIAHMLDWVLPVAKTIEWLLIILTTALTVISAAEYIIRNKEVLSYK
jgi:CDP-diacylglycerol--glycerol-3-phosphate 3-phosphatidyltransferase